MIAILQDIRSVHNVGSIFRTADAAGVEKIYLCGITPEPVDRFGRPDKQFVKVSLGAEKTVAWEKIKTPGSLLEKLKKQGYRIWAIEQDKKSMPYYKVGLGQIRNKNKLALVFGNEVRGISKNILQKADKILEIPMRGKKESLNVSVTFGIIIFHLSYE